MPSVQSTTTDDDFESQGRVNRSLLRTNICARTGADGCSNRERPWPTALVRAGGLLATGMLVEGQVRSACQLPAVVKMCSSMHNRP